MLIAGGFYREISIFPGDDQLFGSGGRAAAALCALSDNIELHTYVGESNLKDIDLFATQWGIDIKHYQTEETLTFEYYHGLSTPIIRPIPLTLNKHAPIRLTGDVILRFGMLEGEAIVEAKTVVYDPQHPHKPQFFDDNGSKADRLAYVLNRFEILALTGLDSVEVAAKTLIKEKKLDALVVKSGAFGAEVWEGQTSTKVSAYETPSIWPIGSGDVFASIFTHYWGKLELPAVEAAKYASRAAAIYCDNRRLQFQHDELATSTFMYQILEPKRNPSDCIIYIAGPFFTMGEYWLVCEARTALIGSGYRTFSPIHDVGLGSAEEVVQKDIDGLKSCHVVLSLCDGLDSGTLFEVGYAVREGIPVVSFAEHTTNEAMKMLKGSGCKLFSDFTTAIYHTQWLALTR